MAKEEFRIKEEIWNDGKITFRAEQKLTAGEIWFYEEVNCKTDGWRTIGPRFKTIEEAQKRIDNHGKLFSSRMVTPKSIVDTKLHEYERN